VNCKPSPSENGRTLQAPVLLGGKESMTNEIEKAIRFKAKLRRGECCIGAQLGLTDPAVVEIFGRAGYDWITVDIEHAPYTIDTVRLMLQAAVATPAVVLARPRKLDLDEIRRYLDIGSPGVMCPFINRGRKPPAWWNFAAILLPVSAAGARAVPSITASMLTNTWRKPTPRCCASPLSRPRRPWSTLKRL